MDLIKDLRAQKKEIQKQISARAQLRKRSKDSIARPKAKKNLFSNDPVLNSISGSSSYRLGVFNLFSSFNKKQSKGFDLKEIEYSNPTDIQKHQEEFDDISFNHKYYSLWYDT